MKQVGYILLLVYAQVNRIIFPIDTNTITMHAPNIFVYIILNEGIDRTKKGT